MDDEENEEPDTDDSEDCEMKSDEDRDRKLLNLIEERLHEGWYKDTESDDDDLEGIVDYLELQGYDGFTNADDEA